MKRILTLTLFQTIFLLLAPLAGGAQTLRIATYNLENFIEEPASKRPLKSAEAQAAVCQSIVALKPDVIALEEMGSTNALLDLQAALKKSGLDLPFWDHITGYDTNIHLALLSRYPIAARHPHTNETFLMGGRRFYVSRGFLDDEIQVNARFRFSLISVHLKSRVPSGLADQQEWREAEAVVLRRIIDTHLAADPGQRLVVLGDFNDTKDSRTLKTVLGRAPTALFDTRPAEHNGQTSSGARSITWTDYFAREDVYSRFDFILLSRGFERDWVRDETYVLNRPDWGLASDHRPLVAGFRVGEK